METAPADTSPSKSLIEQEHMCLDAIDQLRQRKARPDLVRICNMTQRRHGLTYQETENVLERLVESGQVVKVDYKGDISYRNALKWRKSHLGGNVLNAKSTSRRIIDAIVEIRKNESSDRPGASLPEIETWIAENCTVSDLTSKGLTRLDVALDREVEIGRVVRLASGYYVIGNLDARRIPNKDTGDKVQSPNSSFGGFESKAKRARKKKTKSFDPADVDLFANKKAKLAWKMKKKEGGGAQRLPSNGSGDSHDAEIEIPKKQQKEPDTPSPSQQVTSSALGLGRLVDQKCDYCLQYSGLNPKGPPEDLLICEDCNAKAHPSCMNYSRDLARRALSSPWQCIDCKTCCLCSDADDAAEMLFCDSCDKGYHMKCHEPPLVDKPSGKWMCFRCVEDGCQLPDDEPEYLVNGASCLPTPCASPISDFNGNNTKLSSANSAIIRKPEVTLEQANSWSIEDVAKYIADKGFPDHADRFREQEIDGKSLLLMKRGDILTGLSLKLGPALKIHKYVSQLQSDVMDS